MDVASSEFGSNHQAANRKDTLYICSPFKKMTSTKENFVFTVVTFLMSQAESILTSIGFATLFLTICFFSPNYEKGPNSKGHGSVILLCLSIVMLTSEPSGATC